MQNPVMPPEKRRIIHIDMDAFFAAVEQRDNPHLRGKPIAVASDKPRSVIATASYEARKFGIHSAMPVFKAHRDCPDLILVPPRFDVYRTISTQIHQIFRQHTNLVEPASLDEAWLDVSETCSTGIPATQIATEIRGEIFRITGLTASAGVSYNKFLAKLASDQNKPDGMTVITPDGSINFMAHLPVKQLHGIGPATASRMHSLGIRNCTDLREKSIAELTRAFGNSAQYYHNMARGIDPRPVICDRIRKSIGAEETFTTNINDLNIARAELKPLIEQVFKKCDRCQVQGRTVTLKIKYADFEQITRRKTLNQPVQNAAEIAEVTNLLLTKLHPFKKSIRLLGVTLSGLEEGLNGISPQMNFIDLMDIRT